MAENVFRKDNESGKRLDADEHPGSTPADNEFLADSCISSSIGNRFMWPQTFSQSIDAYTRSHSWTRRRPVAVETDNLNYYDNNSDLASRNVSTEDSDLLLPLLQKKISYDVENGEWIHNNKTPASERVASCESSVASTGSSFVQATLNGMNVLAGVGILSTPYALSQGGWLGLAFLFAFSAICLYTGVLLRRCLDTDPAITTYPDVGQAAFGRRGRVIISVCLYFELYCVTVEFLILEGDNLASLFPFGEISLGSLSLTSHQLFVVMSALCMLPTVWLRDLSLMSYISAGGVLASQMVVATVCYVGVVDGVGFHHHGTLLDVSGLPVAVGVYAFCFCGHAVFPSIYKSMRHKRDFSKVLLVCFVLCTLIYGSIGVMGYLMFGNDLKSQVTLNLPQTFLASRVAIWITLVNPFAKYALTITPLAVALEELLPWEPSSSQFVFWGTCIRTLLVASTVAVALLVPLFGYMMAFIGSFLSITVAIILPCTCYLKIFGRERALSSGEVTVNVIFLFVGLVTAFVGTYSAIRGMVGSFR